MSDIKKKFINGIVWSSVEKLGRLGIQFIIGIILARLITPEDFGLLGLITIFIIISETIVNSGFKDALVRDKNIKETTFSSVLIFNFFVSLLIYLVLFASAPLIANFYDEPRLIVLIRTVSFMFVISSLSIVQLGKFQIDLKFKKISLVAISSTVISGVVAIYMAYHGYGVWALVWQRLIQVSIMTLLFWVISDWKFRFAFDYSEIKRLFSFSSKLLISELIEKIYTNISSLLIGKFFTLKDVGYYGQGRRLQTLPISVITMVISTVMYPTFSKLDNDKDLKTYFSKLVRISVFVIFPISFLMILLAKPIVLLLLTEKWSGAIIYLQILAFGGMLYPLHIFNLQIYKIKGRSDIFLKLEVIKKIIGFGLMFVSIHFGVVYLVLFESLSNFLFYPLNAYYNGKFIGYKVLEQLKDVFPTFISALLPAIFLYLTILKLNFSSLILEIIILLIIYLLLFIIMLFIFNRKSMLELKEVLFSILKKT